MSSERKNIIVGVTGGIAAYKVPEFVRALVKSGSDVRIVATSGGMKFITPLVFETITGRPVYSDAFEFIDGKPPHIFLGEWADKIVVAPASADFIAKAVCGLGDELLLSTILATKSSVGVAPSMNWKMWEHPATQRNLNAIKELGYEILDPDEGDLACGEGKGRLPTVDSLLKFVECVLK